MAEDDAFHMLKWIAKSGNLALNLKPTRLRTMKPQGSKPMKLRRTRPRSKRRKRKRKGERKKRKKATSGNTKLGDTCRRT